MNGFLQVSLRQKAVFIPESALIRQPGPEPLTGSTSLLSANLAKLGFGVTEPLLRALNCTTPAFQARLLEQFRTLMRVNQNWTPLVKGWDVPTGESVLDHIITFFANVFASEGTTLPCGHIIPSGSFPLERYNGCPFCGTPFHAAKIEHIGQGSTLKLLSLWKEAQVEQFFKDLLTSRTALDATQMDSLKILLQELPLPEVEIEVKETAVAVVDILLEQERSSEVQKLFKTPVDLLRYLWYKKTGFLQIFKPKTIVKRKRQNSRAIYLLKSPEAIKIEMAKAEMAAASELKLKYSRKYCRTVARWLNGMDMGIPQMCEAMHTHRSMWVRFIRALRLAEYGKKSGFERLKELLDLFYNEKYEVWRGTLDRFRLVSDVDNTMKLLKQRPGFFARSLFANMLWFDKEVVIAAFSEIVEKVPARLLFTLDMYAKLYFDPVGERSVKPLGGINKKIPKNRLLSLYPPEKLGEMIDAVTDLCLLAMKKRYSHQTTDSKSIYIDPMLFKMPVSIGDRSDSVQDLPSALMGTRFKVDGDQVRLFMQWGSGLPAQHLDMDLSCAIVLADSSDFCSYSRLVTLGCKHSGDIRSIPDQVGTAEYIEINLPELRSGGAKYVAFTCNAYSSGSISPNLVVGWMNSEFPMKISTESGVAYDPSCVQHQVRITQALTKGLVFGVLDVAAGEIIWLEMAFGGQVVRNLDLKGIKALLAKLDSKLSIGNMLLIKAEAQNLELKDSPPADEVYDLAWAANTGAVTQLLVD